jgi:hypothetical protein
MAQQKSPSSDSLLSQLSKCIDLTKMQDHSDTVYITLKRGNFSNLFFLPRLFNCIDFPMTRQVTEQGNKLVPNGSPYCLLRVKSAKKKHRAAVSLQDATGAFQSKFSAIIRKELDGLKKKKKKKVAAKLSRGSNSNLQKAGAKTKST